VLADLGLCSSCPMTLGTDRQLELREPGGLCSIDLWVTGPGPRAPAAARIPNLVGPEGCTPSIRSSGHGPALGCPEVCTVRQAAFSASQSAFRQASSACVPAARSLTDSFDGPSWRPSRPALILWSFGVVEQPDLLPQVDWCQAQGGVLEDATKPTSSTSFITPGQATACPANSAGCGPLVHPLGPSWEQRRAMALPGPRPAHHVGWSRHRQPAGTHEIQALCILWKGCCLGRAPLHHGPGL
jgi:hypothetical protein